MRSKILNLLLYAGLKKEDYRDIFPSFMEENIKNLRIYSAFLAIAFAILGVISALSSNFAHVNVFVYAATTIAMGLIFLVDDIMYKKKTCSPKLTYVLVLGFICALYAESIFLATLHPEYPSVTFIVILLMLPLLFSISPVVLFSLQAVATVVFCLVANGCKQPDIISTDIWNGISFFIVSLATILIVIPMRVGSMEKSKRILYVSEHDLLTGVKNRNAYEQTLEQHMTHPQKNEACVYMDVNGLHELNNSQGHDAGDALLRSVAEEIRNEFGLEHSYRIGGDEFVVLCFDVPFDKVNEKASQLSTRLESLDKHVSYGTACIGDEVDDVREMVAVAEQQMSLNKSEFYRKNGVDRRRRR